MGPQTRQNMDAFGRSADCWGWPPAILCIGNPGAGKSTLLNSMIGHVVFESGFSLGCGKTKRLQLHEHAGTLYMDTPGLADPRSRKQAAEAIAEALKQERTYKILFVITLEAGHVRAQDRVSIELVLEALRGQVGADEYAVLVNKATAHDIDMIIGGTVAKELFRSMAATQSVTWVEEARALEDKDDGIVELPRRVRESFDSLSGVPIDPALVSEIRWDKFEELKRKLEDMKLEERSLSVEVPTLRAEIAEFEDRIHSQRLVGESDHSEARPSQEPQPAACRTQEEDGTAIMEQEQSDSEKARNKVLELAHRGIKLGSVLDFYSKLGHSYMPEFDPRRHTTEDVVRAAIIPSTKKVKGSYAQKKAKKQWSLATRMVSHNWSNLFSHFVAAIVADAMDLPTYSGILEQLTSQGLPALRKDLKELGRLHILYWACPFSVNQHRSICKAPRAGDPSCACSSETYASGDPLCEVDKFDEMMRHMLEKAQRPCREDKLAARHVVAVDRGCVIFSRAWVVAELVVAATLGANLQQKFSVYDKDSLQEFQAQERWQRLDIRECKATRPEDTQMILQKAENLLNIEEFNRQLNAKVFSILEKTHQEIEKAEKLHILCMGNAGVGTTTLLNSIAGQPAFVGHGARGEVREVECGGRVLLEVPGLADTRLRRRAAKNITASLKKDGEYKIFFVVTLESGRVRPEDREMISLVLDAAPINDKYIVIINKASPEALRALEQREGLERITHELFSGLVATGSIAWVLRRQADDHGIILLPQDVVANAPSLRVMSGRVREVNSETPEERQAAIDRTEERVSEQRAERDRLNTVLEARKAHASANQDILQDVPMTGEPSDEESVDRIRSCAAFKQWARGMGVRHGDKAVNPVKVSRVHVQSIDLFGPRVGFAKLKTDVTVGGKFVPGIVFLSGGSVAVLVVLKLEQVDYTLLVREPRVAVGKPGGFPEILSDMLMEGEGRVTARAKAWKLMKEFGIRMEERELIDMTALTFRGKHRGIYASPEACTEFAQLFLYRGTVTAEEMQGVKGRLADLVEEGSLLSYELIPLKQLWNTSPDAKALAALYLYDRLVAEGFLEDAGRPSGSGAASEAEDSSDEGEDEERDEAAAGPDAAPNEREEVLAGISQEMLDVTMTGEPGIDIERVRSCIAFKNWAQSMSQRHAVQKVEVGKVHVQSVDMFGPKVGYVKFKADVEVDGRYVPGNVFLRGGTVAVLVVLRSDDVEYAVAIRQPRVAVGMGSLAEILSDDMTDSRGVSSISKEFREESGIAMREDELIDMTALTFPNRFPGAYPYADACDEFVRLLLFRKTIPLEKLRDLQGRMTGVAEEGEIIKHELIPLKELWRTSPDAKTLAALCLHDRLVATGLLTDTF